MGEQQGGTDGIMTDTAGELSAISKTVLPKESSFDESQCRQPTYRNFHVPSLSFIASASAIPVTRWFYVRG
jgi:hypothetical protein